jgi:AmiR/NasT family two-component response regulator
MRRVLLVGVVPEPALAVELGAAGIAVRHARTADEILNDTLRSEYDGVVVAFAPWLAGSTEVVTTVIAHRPELRVVAAVLQDDDGKVLRRAAGCGAHAIVAGPLTATALLEVLKAA